jgi:hypothetical protein
MMVNQGFRVESVDPSFRRGDEYFFAARHSAQAEPAGDDAAQDLARAAAQ